MWGSEWGFYLSDPCRMLDALPETDIFQHPPDVDRVDIFGPKRFSVKMLPKGRGVYCFYVPTTGELVYIGSACGTERGNPDSGIALRMKLYRGLKTGEQKVREVARQEGLLLKVWLTHSEADARKYESDAIRKYKPRLNVVGTRELSKEDQRSLNRARLRKDRIKRLNRSDVHYDSAAIRVCTRCEEDKPCAAFRRCKGKSMGTHAVCRDCEAAERARHSEANGVVRRKLSNDELTLLSRDDLSLREIARRLGMDHKVVAAQRTKLGVLAPNPKSKVTGTAEVLSALIKSLRPGDRLPSQTALAEQLGVSYPTIRKALKLIRCGV